MKRKLFSSSLNFFIVAILIFIAGCSTTSEIQKSNSQQILTESWLKLDTVKAGKFDTGKMWTFDFPPTKYFKQEYNFEPTQQWLNNARLSALRFANYCSASFVSADGLVMTNHHCGRESVAKVTKEGEDLFDNGFYAKTLDEERKVPGLYVDQLVLIKDVTSEVQASIDSGKTAQEKIANEQDAVDRIKEREQKETGLKIQVVSLYDGAKFSVYGYKRYNDVRLVFSPEAEMGYFGGDPDNFTYPRYDLDCNFFRVYGDDGKPLRTEHYFHWSPEGVQPGEPVFVIGNPGRTDRLKTVAQLLYMRDNQYPRILDAINGLVNVYSMMIKEHPERKAKLQNRLFEFANSQKAFTGMLKGLRNPILMQRKIDFENKFKKAVHSDPALNSLFGDLWNKISENRKEIEPIANEAAAFTLNPYTSSQYFFVAQDVIDLADQLKLPEDQRSEEYKGDELDTTINNLIPEDIDTDMNNLLLKNQIDLMEKYLGPDNKILQKITGGNSGQSAVKYMLDNTVLNKPEKLKDLIKKGPDAILNSGDPFIYFMSNTQSKADSLTKEVHKLMAQDQAYSQELGKALFDVYGTSIPPDATFTLRISDGVVKGYPYNGTMAPPFTTFYGLYNRYYSFGQKAPWMLPKEWLNPPADFELNTPMDFVSTSDIIGGNSGSAVINEKAEIVGLAFDGNIESLPGDFIYDPSNNRCVAVASQGMMEAISDMYKATRLSDELKTGHIAQQDTTAVK